MTPGGTEAPVRTPCPAGVADGAFSTGVVAGIRAAARALHMLLLQVAAAGESSDDAGVLRSTGQLADSLAACAQKGAWEQ